MDKPYQVGDRLRVRSWADMSAEFGEVVGSHITTQIPFNHEMRPLCGQPFTVRKRSGKQYQSFERTEYIGASELLNNGLGYWIVTAEMLEPDPDAYDLPEVSDRDFDLMIGAEYDKSPL